MITLHEVSDLITIAPVYNGYAPTDAALPYVVHRPLTLNSAGLALSGDALGWDYQTTLYCCGASVEAAFNLALAVIGTLQGKRVGGSTLSTSIGYSSVQVEGHYESQITVQLNQGGI